MLWNLLIGDLLIIINNSAELKKTKNYNLYNSFIDSLNNIKKSKNEIKEYDIISTLDSLSTSNDHSNLNFIKFKKSQNNEKNIDYYKLFENDKKSIDKCILNNNCLLLNKSKAEDFYDLSDMEMEITSPILKSYFDIEMTNVVKCLKKDLLLNEISIYFNDIFFNDKNFIKIKNSFFCNYKNLLNNNYKNELLKYPSKIKNYSSNKYATPKIFLTCDTTLYNNKYFSKLYPKINKNLVKIKSFPSLPSHYEYNQNLLKNNNIILKTFECEYISAKDIIFGEFYLYDKFFVFKNKEEFGDYKTNIKYVFSTGNNEVSINKKIIVILYNEIEEIITKTFAYINQAFEIFLKNGKSYFFNMLHPSHLKKLFKKLKELMKSNNQELCLTNVNELNEYNILDEKEINKKWKNSLISNYQYLLYLNKYSGRTFNDINQYPIFPWIILTKEFTDNFENNREIYFRDMNYFMTTQTPKGRVKVMNSYLLSEESFPGKATHFTLHYSTAGYILYYLIHTSPFRDANIKFQSGGFDDPHRIINSLDELLSIISQSNDNRELIPEFFTTCEYFYNLNYVFFGLRNEENILINHLKVSPFFKTIEKYIYYNRLLLNNNKENNKKLFPKCQIYNWINLIFGHNQYPTSQKSLNIFSHHSYRQKKNLLKYYEKYEKRNYEEKVKIKKINNKKFLILGFGQCPLQLFNYNLTEPKKLDSSYNFKNKVIDRASKDLKIITFWLSENKSYIFFLTKNSINKKMNILIYDENLIKKSDIAIDKIKLFNCKNDYNRKEEEKNILNEHLIKDLLFFRKEKKQTLMHEQFVLLEQNINENEYYCINDLSDLYILNPRDGIMDICCENNIYFFVGRNKNNSIKIYSINIKATNNGKLIGMIKADSFISVISKKDSKTFFSGHSNGKLIEWEIIFKEIMRPKASFKNKPNEKIISNIILKREIIAHNYTMITNINYNERYNILLTSDDKGFLFIRKYYNFELLTNIQINNNNSGFCFINKLFLNDYDIICCIIYDSINYKSYLSFYSINGILLEKSDYFSCVDACVLKNGKIIFNRLNKDYLYIFGFNGNKTEDDKIGSVIEDTELFSLDTNIINISNFIIDNNTIYILTKYKFIKVYYNKLDQLSYGVDIFGKLILINLYIF